MTVDHFALLFRAAAGTTASLQVAADVVSLALMTAAGVACLIRPPYQDFVIPAVLVWSFVSEVTFVCVLAILGMFWLLL